jgi:hypothetical protein
MQPGDMINFGGDEWAVVEINAKTGTVRLARPSRAPDISMLTFGPQVALHGRRLEEVEVTAEQLARSPTHGFVAKDYTEHIWQELNDPNSVMGSLIKNIAEQFEQSMGAMARQAGPTIGAFKSIADIMGDFPQPDEEETRAARKAELDAQYTEPEGEGFFVFYRNKLEPSKVGISFRLFDGVVGEWVSKNVHRCDSIDDAWAFVDYLKDDEAGEAICIREDSCVLFYRGDAGWEALTRDPVPDEYREEE